MMSAKTDDKGTRQKALDDLASSPSMKTELKPGERLAPDSGYPQKFIDDYNKFQGMYQEQNSQHPEYYTKGVEWWNKVRSILEQHRGTKQDEERAKAIDKLRRPKTDFDE